MTGFRLIAITKKGTEAIKKLGANKDKRALIETISNNPLIISFNFKKRFAPFITKSSIEFFITKTLKGYHCIEDKDYSLEVL